MILDLDEFDRLPEELFAASVSPHLGRSEMLFELRETKAGQLAIMLYSSLPALVRACGTGQAWTKIHNVDLPWLARTVGFDVLVFDLALPAELRNPDLHATEFPDLDAIPADRNPMDKIYVPSKPFRDGDRQVRMELQPDQDGNPALLVYFSAEQLRAGCGPHQPWVAFPIKDLRWLARRAGARSVLFNAILNDAARHPASTRTNKRTR